jgi:hypothetical protein
MDINHVATVHAAQYFCQEGICINGREVQRWIKSGRKLGMYLQHTLSLMYHRISSRCRGRLHVWRFCLETDLRCSYPRLANRHPSNKSATNKVDKTDRPIYCYTQRGGRLPYHHNGLAPDGGALIRDGSLRYLLLYIAAHRGLDQVSQAICRHISLKYQLVPDEPCDDRRQNSLAYIDSSQD